jgi:hypothetical protein
MAIEKVINITANTESANKNVNELYNSLLKADKATEELNDSASSIGSAFDFGSAGNDSKKLDSSLDALKGTTKKLGKEMTETTTSVLENGGAMGLLNDLTGGLAMTFKDGVEALALFSKESKIGMAIQTAYSFVVGASTGAMKLFRLALAGTGIGLIVIALGTLIANFESVQKWVGGVIDRFKNLGSTTKNIISVLFPLIGIIRLIVAGLEELGIIDDDATKKMKANAIAREKQRKEEIKQLNKLKDSITEKYDSEIRLAKAAGKDTEELERRKRFAILETLAALNAADRARIASGKATQDEIKAWNERQKEIKKVNEDIKVSELEAEKEKNDKLAELRKEQAEKRKEEAQKRKEEADKKAQEEKDRIKKEYDDAFKISEDARIANEQAGRTDLENLQAKFEAEKAILEKQKIDTNELELKYLNDKNAILLAQQEKENELRKAQEEADKKFKEDEIAREKAKEETLQNLRTNIRSNTENLLLAIAKKGSALAKGIAIAGIVREQVASASKSISALTVANAQAVAASPLTGGQPFVGLNTASTITGIALSAVGAGKAIKDILSESKNASNPSASGGGASGGGGGGTPAPSFNLVQGTGSNQIAESLATERNPIQAFVVASNVTTAQSLNRNIVDRSTIG